MSDSKKDASAELSAAPTVAKELVVFQTDAVVSRTLIKGEKGSLTAFAFDKGQELSEHTAPFDAMVHVLDGEARVTIGGTPHAVRAGEMLLMPANVPHALAATTPFKMLLTMIRA